jgi:Mg2+ and Co2+ transporter CorA
MNKRPTLELTQWLRDNSSGFYRPAAEAADVIEQLKRERDEAREQRDEAREKLDRGLKENRDLWSSNAELIEQRDRLAEVMTQILNTPMNHTRCELLLEQALQSLTTNVLAIASADEKTTPKEKTL